MTNSRLYKMSTVNFWFTVNNKTCITYKQYKQFNWLPIEEQGDQVVIQLFLNKLVNSCLAYLDEVFRLASCMTIHNK